MRISDWSSDVCSSDLTVVRIGEQRVVLTSIEAQILATLAARPGTVVAKVDLLRSIWGDADADPHRVEVAVKRLRMRPGPKDRTSAVSGKGGSVRVKLGGGRVSNKNEKLTSQHK